MSDSLRPHGPQHARPPCPSPTPRVHPNPCPASRWCHPAISSSVPPLLLPPSILLSIRVFSSESALLIRWPEHWSFSFISPSNEHPGLISFRMDWLDLLAVQGTLKSILQQHSWKASILQGSAFFLIQLSHPYMTRWTYVGKLMSLLLNMLSRLVITFFPRSEFLASGGQSIGVSVSASVLPTYIQDWFTLQLTGRISLQFKGLSRVFSNTTFQNGPPFFMVQFSHSFMTMGKTTSLARRTLVSQVMSLCFLTCSPVWS